MEKTEWQIFITMPFSDKRFDKQKNWNIFCYEYSTIFSNYNLLILDVKYEIKINSCLFVQIKKLVEKLSLPQPSFSQFLRNNEKNCVIISYLFKSLKIFLFFGHDFHATSYFIGKISNFMYKSEAIQNF